MEEKRQQETVREKWKKIFKSLLFCFFVLLFLFLWGFNNYCADIGIPQWLHEKIVSELDECGFTVETESERFSFAEGLHLHGFTISEKKGGIRLSAPSLKIAIAPMDFLDGTLFPVRFYLENGSAEIPLLPESGEEGKTDRFLIHGLNAEIKGAPGLLQVRSASAKIGNIFVSMEGTLDNLLHISVGSLLRGYFLGETERESSPGLMQVFPLETRKKFMRAYLYCNDLNMNGGPECILKFHVDLGNFSRCRIDADFHVPEFRYNDVKFQGARERVSLRNGNLRLEQIRIELGEGSVITAEGNYDDGGKNFSGSIRGNCRILDLIRLTDGKVRSGIEKHVVPRMENVSFDGVLERFSFSDSRCNGRIRMDIPELVVDGILVKNVILSVSTEDGRILGELKRAELENDGVLAGEFFIEKTGGFLCRAHGKTHLSVLGRWFPDVVRAYIRENISFPGNEPIEFAGDFASDDLSKQNCSGSVKVSCPRVQVSGVELLDISADMDFTSNIFHFKGLNGRTGDGSKIEGTVVCDLEKEHIRARGICAGIPGKLAANLDKVWKTDSLSALAKDISCSDPKGVLEADMELFADYGKMPFYQISGSVVMRKPVYCGVPFRYGAARFVTDSDNRVILPDVILESERGTLWLEGVFNADPKNVNGGSLSLNFSSSIPGNDLLKILYPGWKPYLLDFCDPIKVASRGLINYSDQAQTDLKITIQNGTCRFVGVKATDIDADLTYQNGILSFKNAESTICGGVFHGDLVYNVEKENGTLKQKLENADLTTFLREFRISEFAPAGTGRGKLSFESSADFAWNKDDLKMDGTGKLDLSGDELWDIPVLSSFLKYIGTAWPIIGDSTGITRLSCDIAFKGEKAVITDLKSNGKLVTLDADGEFFWNTGDYDLAFRAELLKNALPFDAMSRLLTPVSWILRKSFKGKYLVPKANR